MYSYLPCRWESLQGQLGAFHSLSITLSRHQGEQWWQLLHLPMYNYSPNYMLSHWMRQHLWDCPATCSHVDHSTCSLFHSMQHGPPIHRIHSDEVTQGSSNNKLVWCSGICYIAETLYACLIYIGFLWKKGQEYYNYMQAWLLKLWFTLLLEKLINKLWVHVYVCMTMYICIYIVFF